MSWVADLLHSPIVNSLNTTDTLFGCKDCLTSWVNENTCFHCCEDGTVLARPRLEEKLQPEKSKQSFWLTWNHYIDDPIIIKEIKGSLKNA